MIKYKPSGKVIIAVVVVPLVLMIFVWAFGLSPGIMYSDGHRSGNIIKLSKRGFFYRTWEGELSLSLNDVDSDGAVVARTWDFSVADPAIAAQIEEAEKAGRRVTLHYREYVLRGSYYGDTDYNIIGVE